MEEREAKRLCIFCRDVDEAEMSLSWIARGGREPKMEGLVAKLMVYLLSQCLTRPRAPAEYLPSF
jgi:hypothetical protein